MGNNTVNRPSTTYATHDKRKLASSRSMALLRRQWSSRAHVSSGSKTSPRKSPLRSPASAPTDRNIGPSPDGQLDHHRPMAITTLPLLSPTRNRPLPPIPQELVNPSVSVKLVRRKPVPLGVPSHDQSSATPSVAIPTVLDKQTDGADPLSGDSDFTDCDDFHSDVDKIVTSDNAADTIYDRFAELDITEQFDMLFSDLSIHQDDDTIGVRQEPPVMASSHAVEAKLRSSREQFPEISSFVTRHDSLHAPTHYVLPTQRHGVADVSIGMSTGSTLGPFGSLPGTARIQRSASTSETSSATAPLSTLR